MSKQTSDDPQAPHLAQEVECARVVQVHRLADVDEPQLPLRGGAARPARALAV